MPDVLRDLLLTALRGDPYANLLLGLEAVAVGGIVVCLAAWAGRVR